MTINEIVKQYDIGDFGAFETFIYNSSFQPEGRFFWPCNTLLSLPGDSWISFVFKTKEPSPCPEMTGKHRVRRGLSSGSSVALSYVDIKKRS